MTTFDDPHDDPDYVHKKHGEVKDNAIADLRFGQILASFGLSRCIADITDAPAKFGNRNVDAQLTARVLSGLEEQVFSKFRQTQVSDDLEPISKYGYEVYELPGNLQVQTRMERTLFIAGLEVNLEVYDNDGRLRERVNAKNAVSNNWERYLFGAEGSLSRFVKIHWGDISSAVEVYDFDISGLSSAHGITFYPDSCGIHVTHAMRAGERNCVQAHYHPKKLYAIDDRFAGEEHTPKSDDVNYLSELIIARSIPVGRVSYIWGISSRQDAFEIARYANGELLPHVRVNKAAALVWDKMQFKIWRNGFGSITLHRDAGDNILPDCPDGTTAGKFPFQISVNGAAQQIAELALYRD